MKETRSDAIWKGTLASMAERWATSARSVASWTELDASIAKPV